MKDQFYRLTVEFSLNPRNVLSYNLQLSSMTNSFQILCRSMESGLFIRSKDVFLILKVCFQMARTQRNKATMGHLGLLKARLAKLKRELIEPKGGGGGAGEGFDVAKTGDARVGFVGKNLILNSLQFVLQAEQNFV
jgi:hypothetical protein